MTDGKSPTSDQLRDQIDHGEGGDKVSAEDPASAPLGTDAEAGGNPPTREELELARKGEIAGRENSPPPASHNAPQQTRAAEHEERTSRGSSALWIGAAVVVVIVLVIWLAT